MNKSHEPIAFILSLFLLAMSGCTGTASDPSERIELEYGPGGYPILKVTEEDWDRYKIHNILKGDGHMLYAFEGNGTLELRLISDPDSCKNLDRPHENIVYYVMDRTGDLRHTFLRIPIDGKTRNIAVDLHGPPPWLVGGTGLICGTSQLRGIGPMSGDIQAEIGPPRIVNITLEGGEMSAQVDLPNGLFELAPSGYPTIGAWQPDDLGNISLYAPDGMLVSSAQIGVALWPTERWYAPGGPVVQGGTYRVEVDLMQPTVDASEWVVEWQWRRAPKSLCERGFQLPQLCSS